MVGSKKFASPCLLSSDGLDGDRVVWYLGKHVVYELISQITLPGRIQSECDVLFLRPRVHRQMGLNEQQHRREPLTPGFEIVVNFIEDREAGIFACVREARHQPVSLSEHGWRNAEDITDSDLTLAHSVQSSEGGKNPSEPASPTPCALSRRLPPFGPEHLSVSINRLGEYDAYWESQVTASTDRQEEVRYGARERGYYEIPRQANVRDGADEVDCSKSTATEHL